MLVAKRNFRPTYDGARVDILGGITRVAEDHELALAFPDHFTPEADYDAAERSAGMRAAAEQRAALQRRVDAGRLDGENSNDQFRDTGATTRTTAANPARDAGLRAIERNADTLSAPAADRLDRIIRSHDPHGVESAYVVAVADPDYNSAFGKLLADPAMGHLRFTPHEVAAVQAVNAAESQRGMVGGTTTAGGFALPRPRPSASTSSGTRRPARSPCRSTASCVRSR